MSVVIEISPTEIDPRELARTVTTKFGNAVAIHLCDREIFLANWRSSKSDLSYWKEARAEAELLSNVVVLDAEDPTLFASPEEGLQFMRIFTRIANPRNRQALVELAVGYLRKDALD